MSGMMWSLLIIGFFLIFALLFLLWSRLNRMEEFLFQLSPKVDSTKEVLTRSLDDLKQRAIEAEEKVEKVVRSLEVLSEVNRAIQESTKKFSEVFLSSEKRGHLGEFVLEEILNQFLPRYMFETQCSISGNDRVDAIIKLKNVQVPIDAKFPSESYREFLHAEKEEDRRKAWKRFVHAVKNQIKSISYKYIKPENRTTNYAVMFIPSEPVLSMLTNPKDPFGEENPLWDFAINHRVILAGPYTLLGILSSLLAVSHTEQLADKIYQMQANLKAAEISLKKTEELATRARVSSEAVSKYITSIEKQITGTRQLIASIFAEEKFQELEDKKEN